MSTWKAKALELLPELENQLTVMRDRKPLWDLILREFYSAKNRGDDAMTSRCLRYAAWTLHPAPQAKTIEDVSEAAAELLYQHADDLHRWLDRHDFMTAQKGLRFHLGEQKYAEFEARFLEKTADYPRMQKSKKPSAASVTKQSQVPSMPSSVADLHRKWIAHVFDHPVADREWYWEDNAPQWEDTSEHVATFIAATFERSGELLASFSDEQLNQGFWYMVSNNCCDFMYALVDPAVPLFIRLRALRSFVPVFEQVMAVRCSTHLSHLDERGAKPLNSACYMWWDIIPIHGRPEEPDRVEFDAEVLAVLRRLLTIPQDACRESALHGLGHWDIYYPNVPSIIDEFLDHTPHLRPELVTYANSAKTGAVL